MPGPRREPTEIKRRKGNPGQRPLPDASQVVAMAAYDEPPPPPRHLSEPGRDVWVSVFEGPARNWIGESDLPALQTWCELTDDYVLLRQRLYAAQRTTDPVPFEKGMTVWRARQHVMAMQVQLLRLSREFGFTPSGRAELGVAEVRMAEGAVRLSQASQSDGRDFSRVTVEV